jgi:hypothetical protein
MAAKISVKKDAASDEVAPPKLGQTRPVLGRFRLQVDRQIKQAFDTTEEAELAGAAIKKAYPIVQVSVYDAEKSIQKTIE